MRHKKIHFYSKVQSVYDAGIGEHLPLRILFTWDQMVKRLCLSYLTIEATEISLSVLYSFMQLSQEFAQRNSLMKGITFGFKVVH